MKAVSDNDLTVEYGMMAAERETHLRRVRTVNMNDPCEVFPTRTCQLGVPDVFLQSEGHFLEHGPGVSFFLFFFKESAHHIFFLKLPHQKIFLLFQHGDLLLIPSFTV